MTEQCDRTDKDRLDLSALAPDAADTHRVVGAILASLASRPQIAALPATDVLTIVGRSLPPAWIAAAAALAIAGSAAVVSRRGQSPAPVDVVAMWAEQQHVPTNGELLLAFQGYQR